MGPQGSGRGRGGVSEVDVRGGGVGYCEGDRGEYMQWVGAVTRVCVCVC